MYGLSSFFIGEQRVTEELGPMMRAAPTEEMKVFLATQIADEARHVRFFDRFYDQVGVLESDNLADRLVETSAHLNPAFADLFDGLLGSRVQRLAEEPGDLEALVEAVTLYHMVIEGMLALTGQHFIIDFNEREGTLPGFVKGFSLVARDEHRHVAFGARFLRDMVAEDPRYKEAMQRALEESLPIADSVLTAAVDRGRCGRRAVRGERRRDTRLRRPGADPAPEGDRPGARGGVARTGRRPCPGSEHMTDSPRRRSMANLAGLRLLLWGRHELYVSSLGVLLADLGARVQVVEQGRQLPRHPAAGVQVLLLESPLPSQLRQARIAGPADRRAGGRRGACARSTPPPHWERLPWWTRAPPWRSSRRASEWPCARRRGLRQTS